MKIFTRIRRMLRGEVSPRTAARETLRRTNASIERLRERAEISQLDRKPARLSDEFARLSAAELLSHFRSRRLVKEGPEFFPGFAADAKTGALQPEFFPAETLQLIAHANRIARDHCWPLLGLGEKCFSAGEIDWNLDPLSAFDWPLSYHADLNLYRNDGSDVRVVWELNRMAHLITLGRAYTVTDNQQFSAEFFRQVASWREQNPVGRGVNWNCAMEVALRAMNLLAAFSLFLRSPQMNEAELAKLLRMFDQHGAHIRRNLEFSHIANSNHYLADVAGLLWLGLLLPELESAREWRDFGLGELLREMDKQIFPDGADYEASTGYHRLKLELFLYSFVLCHSNGVTIEETYWKKLRGMIEYVRGYLRPDGCAPLIGDSDSGQVLPIVSRSGDDHAYVLALGAAVFQEPRFKIANLPAPEELLWILGEQGLQDYQNLPPGETPQTQAFADAGTYVLRQDDLYLLFNASGSGVNGRGSHGHNDALSLEVSAFGTAFIVDPGTYVYTADLKQRHQFRSTAYHSTVEVDGVEQNTTDEQVPFIIGNEAQPRVISWDTGPEFDVLVAEHSGYQRLPQPLIHRRTIQFDKRERFWMVKDQLSGKGTHDLKFRFHFAPGLEVKKLSEDIVEARDTISNARLFVCAIDVGSPAQLEPRFSSRDYGAKSASLAASWSASRDMPFESQWAIIPVRKDDDETDRLGLFRRWLKR